MAHYAILDDNNIVINVITGIDETELIDGLNPELWYGQYFGKVCKRTSYNHNIRKQYAGVGYTYDPVADVFIQPSPFPSWVLNSNHDWEAPVLRPDGRWIWHEPSQQWIANT